jgi:mannose-1-phosphate guanylyltransferase
MLHPGYFRVISTENALDSRAGLVRGKCFSIRPRPMERWLWSRGVPVSAERVFWLHWQEGMRRGDWCSEVPLKRVARECGLDLSTVTRAYQLLADLGCVRRTEPGRDPAKPCIQATAVTEVRVPRELLFELDRHPNRRSGSAIKPVASAPLAGLRDGDRLKVPGQLASAMSAAEESRYGEAVRTHQGHMEFDTDSRLSVEQRGRVLQLLSCLAVVPARARRPATPALVARAPPKRSVFELARLKRDIQAATTNGVVSAPRAGEQVYSHKGRPEDASVVESFDRRLLNASTHLHRDRDTWALVLAAGEGSRLRSLTTTNTGTSIPKQFCSLRGGPSLLHVALNRAQALTSTQSICAVVAAQHRRWWLPQLSGLVSTNIIVQPQNRGTANGILLPLLILLERDRSARIVLLPSDHHVRDEPVLARSIRRGLVQLQPHTAEALLLGIEPEEADPQLGYIVPGAPDGHDRLRVEEFIEKPTIVQAHELIGHGALWNGFIVASTVHGLLGLFSRSYPDVVNAMQRAIRRDLRSPGKECAVAELYDQLPTLDFSRDILASQTSSLRVLPVPQCGWSDLGTPERVADVLHRSPREADEGLRVGASYLSLAAQHERLRGLAGEARAAAG